MITLYVLKGETGKRYAGITIARHRKNPIEKEFKPITLFSLDMNSVLIFTVQFYSLFLKGSSFKTKH